MIETCLVIFAATLGWLAFLTCVVFIVDSVSRAWAHPPAIDAVVVGFTMLPWVGGWVAGARIHSSWVGGLLGMLASCAAQFVAVELFDFAHRAVAKRKKIGILEINRTIDRRVGWWRNRMGLWATVPSVPFFLLNRVGHVASYYPLIPFLDFPPLKQSEYIKVSRHKIKNLVGADLVWCLYCDWMTGGWSLTSEMLNEVESYWCPLLFDDKDKCEKCSQFFRMETWATPGASAEELARLAGKKGGGRRAIAEQPCMGPFSNGQATKTLASKES